MADEEDEAAADPWAYLETLAAHSGPHLAQLFEPKNIHMAARLYLKSPPRFEAMSMKLLAYGWLAHGKWRRDVERLARASMEDRAKEKRDDALEARLDEARDAGKPVLDKTRLLDIAKSFAKERRPNLIHWDAYWMDWRDNRYIQLEDGELAQEVQTYMDTAIDANTGEAYVVQPREVEHIVSALRNHVFRVSGQESKLKLPMWLTPLGGEPEAHYTLALKNGLLGLLDGQFDPPSPDFFTRNSLTYPYEPDNYNCPRWLQFLEETWPTELGLAGYHDLLQEVMGLYLTNDMSFQVVVVLAGVAGAGKGVIARLITDLVGVRNTIDRSFSDLFGSAERFAKHDLIDKTLLIIPDAQMKGAYTDAAREFILSISGQDPFMADRKNKPAYNGPLNVRILILTNKDLYVPDQAGALASRYVPFRFSIKKRGTPKQDRFLREKLRAELPAILNWALIGLKRLRERGHFSLPPDSQALLTHIKRHSAPCVAFLEEVTEEEREGNGVTVKKLYDAYRGWHRERMGAEAYVNGDEEAPKFAELVYTAIRIAASRRSGKTGSPMVFRGLRIRDEYAGHVWPETVESWDAADDEPWEEDGL